MIECQICHKEFKQITITHLKYIHNITIKDYELLFPNIDLTSIETRNKKSKSGKKKIFTETHKKNISVNKMGDKNAAFGIPSWNKGIPSSIDTRKKQSESHIGRKRPEEEKQQIRNTVKIRIKEGKIKPWKPGKEHPFYGKPAAKGSGYGKRSYYNSPLQGKVCFRSSYELAYAKYLDEHKISWLYENKTFDLGDTTYTPDFFLPKTNQFIEIKGYMHTKAQIKINKFLEQYPWDLKILYREDLIKLGCEL